MKNSNSCWTIPPVRKSLKIVVLGDFGVGKSMMVNSICRSTLVNTIEPTIAVDYHIKEYKSLILNIWDVSGNPYYRQMAKEFYEDTSVFILVFDVTNRRSYESLQTWKEEVKNFVINDCKILICGNKTDLSQFRQVTYQEASYFAMANCFNFLEVSAIQSHTVKSILQYLDDSYNKEVFHEC
jgi:small GTP-binding protein